MNGSLRMCTNMLQIIVLSSSSLIGRLRLDGGAKYGIFIITNLAFSKKWKSTCRQATTGSAPRPKLLAEDGTLNTAPEKVRDPKFHESGFSTRAMPCR